MEELSMLALKKSQFIQKDGKVINKLTREKNVRKKIYWRPSIITALEGETSKGKEGEGKILSSVEMELSIFKKKDKELDPMREMKVVKSKASKIEV